MPPTPRMSTLVRLLTLLAVVAACVVVPVSAAVPSHLEEKLAGRTDIQLANQESAPYPVNKNNGDEEGSAYTDCTLENGVFTIQGAKTMYADTGRPTGLVQVLRMTVSDGSVVVTGFFPVVTLLNFSNVKGTVSANRPLIDATAAAFDKKLEIAVIDSSVAWSAAETLPSMQVLLGIPATLDGASSVFVLGVHLTSASAVVKAAIASGTLNMQVVNSSVVAVDYVNCTTCANGIIDVAPVPIFVLNHSMIRVSHITLNATPTVSIFMTNLSTVTVDSTSLLVVENITARSSNIFSSSVSNSGSNSVVLRYLHINSIGTALGSEATYTDVTAESGPSDLASATHVEGKCPAACLNGFTLTNAQLSCNCTCNSPYHRNYCTAMNDPLASYNPTGCTEGCIWCHNETACSMCSADYTLDTSTAVCKRNSGSCDANCVKCGASMCMECKDGYGVANNGVCVRCAVDHCKKCNNGYTDVCTECMSGTTLISNVCVPSCEEGYGLVNGTCVKCADPYCRHCDINPSRCEKCVDRMIPDSVTGKCINSGDCSVANCKVCDATSAVLCNTCNDGYYLSLNRSACLQASTTTSTTTPTAPCNVPNCLTCYPNDGNVCQYCRSGYYTFNGQCVPIGNCYVGNCAQCMLRDGTKCSTCRNGYFLSSTYTCLSQHVNVNGAAAPHSLWLAAVAVLLASAVTHLA